MLAALALAVAPLLWAGAEKEIVLATSVEMVDRFIPTTVTYVSLPGLAMDVSLPAPGSQSAPPYGLLVRDTAGANAFTIVTSDVAPERLEARWVVGRVTTRPIAAAAIGALDTRGEATTGLDGLTLLIEVAPQADEPITDVQAVADLVGMTDGSLVRIPLRFAGESMPTCALAVEGCQPACCPGNGIFVHSGARDPGPGTHPRADAYPYPWSPDAGPGHRSATAPTSRPSRLTLPVRPSQDRAASWYWPRSSTILVSSATGFGSDQRCLPCWQASVAGWATLSRSSDRRGGLTRYGSAFAVQKGPLPRSRRRHSGRVSGHATTVDGRRAHLDEVRAVLLPSTARPDGNRATAALSLPDGEEVALAAYDIGALGSVERGEVVRVGDVRPALWAHWFGTDLRLTFGSAAERDIAAAIARTAGPPLGSDR